MNWFANKGQVVQVAIQVTALLVAIKVAFPAMSSNNFFSAGTIVFYLLLVSLFVSVWLLVRGERKRGSYNQANLPLMKADAAPPHSIPAVVFVVEESWVDYEPSESFPLRLWVRWANEGVQIHLKRPRWASENIGYQGQRVSQGPMCRFKHKEGKFSVEGNSVTALCGQRGEIWFALDPSFDVEQVRRWKEAKQLGLLILPIVVGVETNMEIQVQL